MSKKVNTEINYCYRDFANYRYPADPSVVVAGLVTQEELLECCCDELGNDQNLFIPHQVGLEDLQSKAENFPSSDDHVWHELEEVEPTDKKPTIKLTAAQLLKNFKSRKDKWDMLAAMRKVGML